MASTTRARPALPAWESRTSRTSSKSIKQIPPSWTATAHFLDTARAVAARGAPRMHTIEELDQTQIANVPFDALTGLKAFVVANALSDVGAPKEIISPLVQHLPKLWELMHHYGMTTLELNPIRMR